MRDVPSAGRVPHLHTSAVFCREHLPTKMLPSFVWCHLWELCRRSENCQRKIKHFPGGDRFISTNKFTLSCMLSIYITHTTSPILCRYRLYRYRYIWLGLPIWFLVNHVKCSSLC